VRISPTKNERGIELVARTLLIEATMGKKPDEKTRDQLDADIPSYAAELAGPNASPAERMLADVAALDWRAICAFESRLCLAMTGGSLSIDRA
jgi:hypothetical protein